MEFQLNLLNPERVENHLESGRDKVLPSLTFVTCLEAGPLEQQVIRMVTSLRKWGGRFANAPVYAVNPRFDILKINPQTFLALADLGVNYLSIRPKNSFPWFRFLNKPVSVAAVEALVSTDFISFLDGDVLVVREPAQLDLGLDFDLGACIRDKGGIATMGPEDPNEAHWKLLCGELGLKIEEFPFVTELCFKERIRLYCNAGIFSYRRNTGFATRWRDNCTQLLRARIAHTQHNVYFLEQAAFSLTIMQLGLRLRQLEYSHNHGVGKLHFNDHFQDQLGQACLLHYHEAMSPPYWEEFLGYVERAKPEVAEWLRPQGPILKGSSVRQSMRDALRSIRYIQQLAHIRQCRTS